MTNIYALLNPDSAIQALVGLGTSPQSSKIYPGVAAQTVDLPLIEYNMVGETKISTIAGVGDPANERVQISCHADTYDEANTLADAVFDALEGNGYQLYRSNAYQQSTKTFSVFIDWGFLI
jgi:hypothetical protein